MWNRALSAVAGTFILLGCAVPLLAGEAKNWPAILSEEAPKNWASYYDRAKRLQGFWTITLRQGTEKVWQQRMEIKQRKDCALFQVETVSGLANQKDGELKAFNLKYNFSLVRFKAGNGWAVGGTGVKLWDPSRKNDKNPAYYVEYIRQLPYTFSLLDDEWSMTILDTDFHLLSVEPLDEDDEHLVKATFTRDWKGSADPVRLRTGWLAFDPEHYWSIRKCYAEREWGKYGPGTESVNYEYQYEADGFPIVKRAVEKRHSHGKDHEFEFNFDLREEEVPEREFTLSAFGFPEPEGMVPLGQQTQVKPSRWYIGAAIAGGVLLLAGVFFFLRSKRQRAAAGGPMAP